MKTRIQKTFSAGAFTLVELLVVIAIIAVLAGLIIPTLSAVKKTQYRKTAQAELKLIEGALENYKLKYGTYPPANPAYAQTNGLFYELMGTTNAAGTYLALDRSAQAPANPATLTTIFGVQGFVNSDNSAKSAGEDAHYAQSFLSNLRAGQTKDFVTGGYTVRLLVTSVLGPDTGYQPLLVPDLNPFRYIYPGTNNPGSYDLWVDLVISGKTIRIANWKTQ